MEGHFSAGSSSVSRVHPSACSRSGRFLAARSRLRRRILQQEITPTQAARTQQPATEALRAEGMHHPPFILPSENKFTLKIVLGLSREAAV